MKNSFDSFLFKRLAIFTLLTVGIPVHDIHAQVPFNSFGSNLGNQHWMVIDHPYINVIYPGELTGAAQRMVNLVGLMTDSCTRSIGPERYKMDWYLQSQTVINNGYVTLAPAKCELFCTSPAGNFDFGTSLDYLDLLTIHEYRHVLQHANSRNGLTRVGSILGGQILWSTLLGLSVPIWYFEGDAVIAETALSPSGRGRAPSFTKELRAMEYEGVSYRYQKLRNGSLKNQLPSHYPLGYLMLTHVRNEKGNDITATVFKEATAYKGLFYPFSRAMKRNTGYNVRQLYKTSFSQHQLESQKSLESKTLTPSERLTPKNQSCVTYYMSPRFLSDGSLLVYKASFKKTSGLYRIKNGKEHKVTNIGLSTDRYITVGHDVVAWTELSTDPRRINRTYSNIVLFDLKENTKRRLTSKTRYFSPVVSMDGSTVAAIHVGSDKREEIHILDRSTAKVIKTLAVPDGAHLTRLAWMNEQELVSISNQNSQSMVVKFDLASGKKKELSPGSHHTIEGLGIADGYVYFQSDFEGIDNIYKVSTAGTKEIYQVTSVPVGAYFPDVDRTGEHVVYSEINASGYHLSKASAQGTNSPIVVVEPADMEQFNTMANRSEGGNVLARTPQVDFESHPYKGLFKGVQLHSWLISPSYTQPSITLSLQNTRNDVKASFTGGVNRNEDNNGFYNAEIKFARYFPEITFRGGLNNRSTDFYNAVTDSLKRMEFNEFAFGGSIGVPLYWRTGDFTTELAASAGYTQYALSDVIADDVGMSDRGFESYDLQFDFSCKRRIARQNVGSRLGVEIGMKYIQSFNFMNEKFNGSTSVFLPGFGANHHMMLKVGYQKEPLENYYQFVDDFEYPRGFGRIVNDEVSSYSFNYGLPLFYPDFGLAGITYFKRVRTNLFYDAAVASKLGRSTTYSSAGFELVFDNVNLNYTPLSFGIRTSYLLDGATRKGDTGFGFFISTTIP